MSDVSLVTLDPLVFTSVVVHLPERKTVNIYSKIHVTTEHQGRVSWSLMVLHDTRVPILHPVQGIKFGASAPAKHGEA